MYAVEYPADRIWQLRDRPDTGNHRIEFRGRQLEPIDQHTREFATLHRRLRFRDVLGIGLQNGARGLRKSCGHRFERLIARGVSG